jgi:hypothetical protein
MRKRSGDGAYGWELGLSVLSGVKNEAAKNDRVAAMKGAVINLAAATWLALALAFTALWIRSYWFTERVTFFLDHPTESGITNYSIASACWSIQLGGWDTPELPTADCPRGLSFESFQRDCHDESLYSASLISDSASRGRGARTSCGLSRCRTGFSW